MNQRLIVGLGNPGAGYTKTRHNIGFRIVERLSQRHGIHFHQASMGKLGEKELFNMKIHLFLPYTYMNSSGGAILPLVKKLPIGLEEILVICDDVALPLGQLRLRAKGGPGGHNGLKSLEEHLKSDSYARLRVGVGEPRVGEDLAAYVLAPFSPAEEALLPECVDRACEVVEEWLQSGIDRAMQTANRAVE